MVGIKDQYKFVIHTPSTTPCHLHPNGVLFFSSSGKSEHYVLALMGHTRRNLPS